jgi:hypothetical protein
MSLQCSSFKHKEIFSIIFYQLVRKHIDLSEHKRLSNIAPRHKLKKRNNVCIAVLHFTVNIGSSTMSITHTQK